VASDQPGHRLVAGERRGIGTEPHVEGPDLEPPQELHLAVEGPAVAEQSPTSVEHDSTDRGGLDPVAATVEDGRSETRLEVLDAAGDCRLGHAERVGRPAEPSMLGDGEGMLEVTKVIHDHIIVSPCRTKCIGNITPHLTVADP
jgi:hypothetical protein